MKKAEAVIVGGGHNGLTAAAYLAKGGLPPIVLERRPVVGGAAVSEEFAPGFRNSVASYVVSLLRPEIVRDLELEKYGYELFPLENTFGPTIDGRPFLLTGDPEHDRRQIGQFSNRDYDAMVEFNELIEAATDVIRGFILREPPKLTDGGVPDFLTALKLGREFKKLDGRQRQFLIQMFVGPLGSLLDRWFESEPVKTIYAATGTAGNCVSLWQPGSALNLLHLDVGETDGRRGAWAIPRGGMGSITQAMAKSAVARGVDIRTDAAVARIIVENETVVGVELESGDRIETPIVLANTEPKLTFLRLVGREYLDDDFAADIAAYRTYSGSLRMNLALSGLPNFAALPSAALGEHHKSFMRFIPSIASMEEAFHAAGAGRLPKEPTIDALMPSAFDDSLAPEGCHVMSLLCQQYPLEFADGRDWEEMREEAAEQLIDSLARYIPGIRKLIVGRQVLSPLDLERIFGLTGGDVYHGRLDPDQLFSMRPHPKAAQYATPVKGLYLCGSGAHPGGGVSGAPGHNCARRVLKDLPHLRS